MTSILQDVRFALRRLRKDRSFAVAAIAALVLGIGANSAVFTIVNGVLLRSLPFDDPDRIVRIDTRDAQGRERGTSLDDFYDWQRASRAFSGMALAYYSTGFNLSADSDPPERYNGAYISANGFAVIGVTPAIGRGFTAEDDRPALRSSSY